MADIAAEDFARLLRGENEIPMLTERWHNVQELGRVLRDRYSGSAARLVEQADHDAARLAHLIVENLASFNDTTLYRSHGVNLFKRAQILVADLYGAFRGEAWGRFDNLAVLTSFADYKLPQILRAWGILKYERKLARRVDGRIEIEKDSPEEVEIRASMLWGVELLREAVSARGQALTSVQMDWYLWEASQNLPEARPYHRVRTIYY
jgi:hypothetical protein